MLRIALLGRYDVRLEDEPVDLKLRPVQLLLAYLLLRRGKTQRREQLAGILWPDYTDASARKNLSNTIYRLRRIIGENYLVTDRSSVAFNSAAPYWLDLVQFEEAAAAESVEELGHVVGLYHGELLPGFYEDWILWERERLQALFERAMLELLQTLNAAGRWSESLTWAEHWIAQGQVPEPAYRILMAAHAALGDQASAVKAYRRGRHALEEALGVPPAAETERLYQELLAAAAELPPMVAEQVTLAAAEPLSTALRHNLPAQLSSFVGREREVTEIQRLLSEARLVTLTGPGGTGKTRVALRAAANMAGDFDAGVAFITLDSTRDPESVPQTIALEFGVKELPDRPLSEVLKRFLAMKQMLLVLDNFEHLLSAAPLVSELLNAAPQLTVLATSREALNLSGEHEYQVPPLALPDSESRLTLADLKGVASVRLFVERAHAVQKDFHLTEENGEAIATVCRLLDGLPLAIELAAARSKLFSPQQLLAHLESRLDLLTGGPRDLPLRQRTLRDTIDWSYDLLDKNEQKLFARLGVFTSGGSLEAVEAICGPGLDIDALVGLEPLLNKSLLYQKDGPGGELRFIMLETIREFARERLAESGEEKLIRNRHLDYFRDLVEEMEPGYRRSNQVFLLERTKVELGNLRAAFEWAMDNGNVEAAARLISSIDYYFQYKGNLIEGYRWFMRVMGEIDKIPKEHLVRFLLGANRLAWVGDTHEQEIVLGQQALTLARELGDRSNEAWLLATISSSLNLPEEYEAAIKMSKRALTIFRELDDKPGMAYALNALGEVERLSRNYERAKAAYEETLAICRETGEIYRQSMNLANLAFVAYDEGEYERGMELAMPLLGQRMGIDWVEWAIVGLMVLAGPLGKLDQPEKAARMLGASTTLMAEMGIYYQAGDQPEADKYIANVRIQLDEATFKSAWAQGQTMTLEQALVYALGE